LRAFFTGDADAVVERAQPGSAAISAGARSCRCHELAALVAAATKAKSSSSCCHAAAQAAARRSFVLAAGDRPQAVDLGVALEHLEAHPHFVDAVMNGFQLGRLVDHVLGRRHLAAVVQPGGNVQCASQSSSLSAKVLVRSAIAAQAASASILVSSGTRAQWPPV
jgi:hypothetical protein